MYIHMQCVCVYIQCIYNVYVCTYAYIYIYTYSNKDQ